MVDAWASCYTRGEKQKGNPNEGLFLWFDTVIGAPCSVCVAACAREDPHACSYGY